MRPDGPLLQILTDHIDELVNRLAIRVHDQVPGYARLEGPALHESVRLLVVTLLEAISTGDNSKITERVLRISRERVDQGFSTAEFLRALFLVLPVARELFREVGPRQDPSFAKAFSELEDRMHELAAMSANIYAETAANQLRHKNLELNRLNQELQRRQAALAHSGEQIQRELASVTEFNQRVIEALSSGIVVVDHKTLKVTLFSQRAEAISDLTTEEVLGRDVTESLGTIRGIDHYLVMETVRATGRFPLTKLNITTKKGRRRTVYLRASRLYAPDGTVEGTVVVVDDVSERELLIDSFSRYVSRDLVNRLLARHEPLGLEGERRVATVLFADIRGFTGIAELLAPEALHRLLNEYLHVMVESIVEHGGFIDKFVGDKVMALFTGPRSEADAAFAAVEAARSIHARIAAHNVGRRERGEYEIAIGIGINTGPVVVGNVGDEARMDFTAIGDAVNVADRLQSMAEGGQTVVGGLTGELVKGRVPLRDLGERMVKGRSAAVAVLLVEGEQV